MELWKGNTIEFIKNVLPKRKKLIEQEFGLVIDYIKGLAQKESVEIKDFKSFDMDALLDRGKKEMEKDPQKHLSARKEHQTKKELINKKFLERTGNLKRFEIPQESRLGLHDHVVSKLMTMVDISDLRAVETGLWYLDKEPNTVQGVQHVVFGSNSEVNCSMDNHED